MAFGNLTVDFKQLSRIPVRDRMALAQSPQASQIFGNLTPSQIAGLFPDYYKRALNPMAGQVSSFAAALSGAASVGTGSTSGGGGSTSATPASSSTTPAGSTRPGFIQEIIGDAATASTAGTQYGEGSNNSQIEVLKFARRWGISPQAAAGVLNIESGVKSNIQGGRGGNFYGVFQLQGEQIPDLTERAGFGKLTAQQYKELSVGDQLKVMDEYYKKAGVQPGFFTGDPEKDAAKMWALQLAPSNAQKINYDDPNAVISNTDQANAIEVKNGVVTVGSAGKGSIPGGQKFLEGAELTGTGLPGTQAITGEASVGSDANIIPLIGTTAYTVQESGSVLGANERREIRERGGITINLDNNAGASASVTSSFNPMIVIPDDATDAQRAAAQSYVDSVAAAYNAKFGKKLKGVVKTTSENQRGRADVIHTEPFNIRDKDAIQYFYHTDEGRAELARITSTTLGQIPGAHFQLPHGGSTGKDQGAIGPLGSEVELANILLGNLSNIKKNQTGGATAEVQPQITTFDASIFTQLDPRVKEEYDRASSEDKRLLEMAIMKKGVGTINEIMAKYPVTSAVPAAITQSSDFSQNVTVDDDVMYGRKPYITGHDFAVPVYTNGSDNKIFDEDLTGMTPQAIARLKAAAVAAKAAGLSKLVVAGGKDSSGHVSHMAGTEYDVKGYDANGNVWNIDQRAITALGAAEAGSDRFGFYPGGTLHFGKANEVQGGPGISSAWGPRTEGVDISEFNPGLEKQIAATTGRFGSNDLPKSETYEAHKQRFAEAVRQKELAQQTAQVVQPEPGQPLPGAEPQTAEPPKDPTTGGDVPIEDLKQPTAEAVPAKKLGGTEEIKEPNSVKESMSLVADGKEVAKFNKNEEVNVADGKINVQNEYQKKTNETQQKTDKGSPQQQQQNTGSMRGVPAQSTDVLRRIPEGYSPISPSAMRAFANIKSDRHWEKGLVS